MVYLAVMNEPIGLELSKPQFRTINDKTMLLCQPPTVSEACRSDRILKRIVVTAKEVKGTCHAGIKPGSRFVIEGSNLLLKESDVVCPVAFASMYYRLYAHDKGAKVGRFIQCPDSYIWGPNAGTGSVLFEINVEEK